MAATVNNGEGGDSCGGCGIGNDGDSDSNVASDQHTSRQPVTMVIATMVMVAAATTIVIAKVIATVVVPIVFGISSTMVAANKLLHVATMTNKLAVWRQQ